MKVYLDNCCYNRPFDDQSQQRIFEETNAIFEIINRSKISSDIIFGSDILILEISKIKNFQKQRQVLAFYSQTVNQSISFSENIEQLAEIIVNQSNIQTFDALHLASAITESVDIFLTTDDKLIKACEKLNLKILVMNPINFRGDLL